MDIKPFTFHAITVYILVKTNFPTLFDFTDAKLLWEGVINRFTNRQEDDDDEEVTPSLSLNILNLPTDIALDILSRTSADHVLECQKMSHQWRVLTSSTDFVALHVKRATTPTVFIDCGNFFDHSGGPTLFSVELFGRKKKKNNNARVKAVKTPVLKQWNLTPRLLASCNGLLLLCYDDKNTFEICICNPTTLEEIVLYLPRIGVIHGFFFHPSINKYCLLHRRWSSVNSNDYWIFTLGERSWRKVGIFPYRPGKDDSDPVNINGVLYWTVHRYSDPVYIMTFDIEKEKFGVMHGPRLLVSDEGHVQLLEMDGSLSVCVTRVPEILIFRLTGETKKDWLVAHRVKLDWWFFRDPPVFEGIKDINSKIRVRCFQNGEVLISWTRRGLYQYNLARATVKKIGCNRQFKAWDLCATKSIKSLVSFRDF